MKTFILISLTAILSGCGFRIIKQAELDSYCDLCSLLGKADCHIEQIKIIDAKSPVKGLLKSGFRADVERDLAFEKIADESARKIDEYFGIESPKMTCAEEIDLLKGRLTLLEQQIKGFQKIK